MMVTISHVVKKIVAEQPFIEDALGRGLISFGNFAEHIIPKVEQELEKRVHVPAVVMALRRYAEEISAHRKRLKHFDFSGEIIMKTNICDFTVRKSALLLQRIKGLHSLADYDRGDTLNVIIGNNEVSIITNEKHSQRLAQFLAGEKIINRENGLVALTVIFTRDDFLHTPGVIFNVIRKLAWENINIFEIISTMTELTLILSKKDSLKAYDVLYDIVQKKGSDRKGFAKMHP